MKTIRPFVIILLLISAIPIKSFATIVTSNGTGDWGSAGSWTPGIPACGDTIYIRAGDVISIQNHQDYSGCGLPMFLIIDGTLDFPVNGPKLRLPCNSGVTINSGGLLTASGGGGGGSANFLEICSTVVWKKADGPMSGPVIFGTPVPIELISFEATINDDKVDIKWITASEINNHYFTVERSVDAINWEEVMITNGAGNSNQLLEYFETDHHPIIGLSYYRLKQTDFDEKFTYSNVVPVRFEVNRNINLFPSPVSPGETVNIEFEHAFESELLVVLRDIKGREFYSKVIVNIENSKLVAVPIEISIPAGVYLITATSENLILSHKLIIK